MGVAGDWEVNGWRGLPTEGGVEQLDLSRIVVCGLSIHVARPHSNQRIRVLSGMERGISYSALSM